VPPAAALDAAPLITSMSSGSLPPYCVSSASALDAGPASTILSFSCAVERMISLARATS